MSENNISIKEISDAYDRYREHIQTENGLYNQRIIWLITIQAFLFATIGLLFQARFFENASGHELVIDLLAFVICILGIAISRISENILGFAREHLKDTRNAWNELLDIWEKDSSVSNMLNQFPHVAGRLSQPDSMFRSGNLPKFFAFTWIAFIIIVVYAQFKL